MAIDSISRLTVCSLIVTAFATYCWWHPKKYALTFVALGFVTMLLSMARDLSAAPEIAVGKLSIV